MTVEEFDKKLNEAADRYIAAMKGAYKVWSDDLGKLFDGLETEEHLAKASIANVLARIEKEIEE